MLQQENDNLRRANEQLMQRMQGGGGGGGSSGIQLPQGLSGGGAGAGLGVSTIDYIVPHYVVCSGGVKGTCRKYEMLFAACQRLTSCQRPTPYKTGCCCSRHCPECIEQF